MLMGDSRQNHVLPKWLNQLLSQNRNNLKLQKFTDPLDIHSRIRGEYLKALQNHANCNFCLGVHIEEWFNILRGAREQVGTGT